MSKVRNPCLLFLIFLILGFHITITQCFQLFVSSYNKQTISSIVFEKTTTLPKKTYFKSRKGNHEIVLENVYYECKILRETDDLITLSLKEDKAENFLVHLFHSLFQKKNNEKKNSFFAQIMQTILFYTSQSIYLQCDFKIVFLKHIPTLNLLSIHQTIDSPPPNFI